MKFFFFKKGEDYQLFLKKKKEKREKREENYLDDIFSMILETKMRRTSNRVTTSKSAPCASRGECYSCFNADVEIVPNSLEKN